MAFKEKVLPPGAVASLKDSRLQGISVGDPTAAEPGEASAGGSLDVSTCRARVGSDASDPAGAQEGHPTLFRARASRQSQNTGESMTQNLDHSSGSAPQSALLPPQELAAATELIQRVLGQLDQTLLGRRQLHRMVLVGILSRGHILLEGLPGVGKTALIKALGQTLHLQFNRVQFTPDLMPSDILGTHILRESPGGGREMAFQTGPVFTNILLADEINRASPKTQSALLEAMQEGSVTLLGHTRPLPQPFFVLASQNPIELEGTYPLPEAQLDRFLFKLTVSDVNVDVLTEIIATRRRGEPPAPDKAAFGGRSRAAVGHDGADLFAPARLPVHLSPGGGDAPAERRGDGRSECVRHVRRLAAGGHRHGRSGPRTCAARGAAQRGLRGRQGRRRAGDESSADSQLQGPLRPGQHAARSSSNCSIDSTRLD